METPAPTPDDGTIPGDTATHRLHMMQMSIQQIGDLITKLQTRRASQSEKITKAKANKDVARALTVDKQFARLVGKLEKKLQGISEDLDDVADDLNKARALFFEASNGTIIMEKEK